MTDTIRYGVDSDGIATLTIDVPGKPMNVFTPGLLEDLDTCVNKVVADDAVRGAIITSGKPAFIAGADLKDLVTLFDRGLTAADIYEHSRFLTLPFRKLETSGKPFVAAINGTALGGGLELCLACHYRVAAANPATKIGLPEVTVGLLPGAGGTQRLPRMIGIQPALEVMTLGRHMDVARAHKLGIVDAVVEPPQLLGAAKQWLLDVGNAEQPWDRKGFKVPGGAGLMHPRSYQTLAGATAMTARATQHNYPAPIAILSAVYEGTVVPLDTGLEIESQYFAQLLAGPVARNMIRSLFVNKGAADKLSRRPEEVPASQVRKLAMLGAGMMGAGIAYVTARAGIDVVLLDSTVEKAGHGKSYSSDLLAKAVAKGRMTEADAEAVLGRIVTTDSYADIADADLVIEAVFENRAIKADVTAKTEAVISPGTIFASNTSTLPITGLAEAAQRPEKFIGLHFFSPVDKMPLVEVILGEKTSDEALAHALDFVRQIRKTPIVVNDSRGFYTSRVFGTYTNEGAALLADGVPAALIENVAKMAGMPVGPLAVADEVTLELAVKIVTQSIADLGDAYPVPSAHNVAVRLHDELGRSGKRFGKGFYEYPEGGEKYLWPGLAELWPPAAEPPSVDEIRTRLLYIQALETARCFEENVVTNAAEADIGSIFGWGFPAWTGGTLSFIDTIGVADFVAECDRLAETYGPRFAVSPWLRDRAATATPFHT